MEKVATPEMASDPWPPFGERLRMLLQSPAAALRGAAAEIDWVRPAIMMLCGMLLYMAPVAYRTGLAQNSNMQSVVIAGRTQRPGGTTGARQAQPMPPFFNTFLTWMGAFTAFASVFNVAWVVAGSWFTRTAVFYALGRAFGGLPRSFFPLFAAVGWAWFPLFIQNVLVGLAFAFVPGVLQFFVPMPANMQSPASTFQAVGSTWHVLLLQFATPLVWWNWYCCALAVEGSMELPRWKAMLVVAIQVLAHASYSAAAFFAMGAWLKLMQGFAGPAAGQ